MLRRIATFVIAALVLPVMAMGEDSPRDIVERGIAARGGEDQIAKFDAMRFKVKGTMYQGKEGTPFVMEETWHLPDRFRTVMTLVLPNTTNSQTFIINGDKAWMKMQGNVVDLPKHLVEQLKEQKQAQMIGYLQFLDWEGVELESLEEIMVEGSPAQGVLVKAKNHPEVSLYFDKKTDLLVKRVNTGLDPAGGETEEEIVFGDFKKRGKFMLPRSITMISGGKTQASGEVIEIEFLEALDEDLFSKPS